MNSASFQVRKPLKQLNLLGTIHRSENVEKVLHLTAAHQEAVKMVLVADNTEHFDGRWLAGACEGADGGSGTGGGQGAVEGALVEGCEVVGNLLFADAHLDGFLDCFSTVHSAGESSELTEVAVIA